MAKLFTYVIIMAGMMALFTMAGISTTGGYILGTLGMTGPGSLVNIQSSNLWLVVVASLAILAGVTAIVIGIFGHNVLTTPLTAGIAGLYLLVFILDLVGIVTLINASASWAGWFVYLISAPLIIGYIIAIWDWMRSSASD